MSGSAVRSFAGGVACAIACSVYDADDIGRDRAEGGAISVGASSGEGPRGGTLATGGTSNILGGSGGRGGSGGVVSGGTTMASMGGAGDAGQGEGGDAAGGVPAVGGASPEAGGSAGEMITGGVPGVDAGAGGEPGPGGVGGAVTAGTGGGPQGGTSSGGTPAEGGSGGEVSTGGMVSTGGSSSGGSAGAGGAGGAEPGPLFAEDFEAGVDRWSPVGDGWSVTLDGSNNVYLEANVSNMLRASAAGDVSWTDMRLEARVQVVTFTPGSTSYVAAIFARYVDTVNYYSVVLMSDGRIALRRRCCGGSPTTLGTPVDPSIVAGTWYQIGIEASGTTISALLDGAAVITVDDAQLAAGRIAVGTVNTSAMFDDVLVTLP